jgi:hypothetical protein
LDLSLGLRGVQRTDIQGLVTIRLSVIAPLPGVVSVVDRQRARQRAAGGSPTPLIAMLKKLEQSGSIHPCVKSLSFRAGLATYL